MQCAMQCIVETVESSAGSSLDSGLEQGAATGGNGTGSFGYDLLRALQAMLGGDFSVRMVSNQDGLPGKIAEAVNGIASNLAVQVRNITDVTIAVANGDLSKKISVNVRGEILQLEQSINTIVDQLREMERVRRALEEKAMEIALASKRKSEFLAKMSHELRTPLNSILVLGQQLSENSEGNLSAEQIDFARTIHAAGADVLNLISDILDLAKIESGTVTVEPEEVLLSSLLETVARPFRHEAATRRLSFDLHIHQDVTRSIVTDAKRLQQILKNLLSNAFKFTEQGGVRLCVAAGRNGWNPNHEGLNDAPGVIVFAVSDTGIGIPPEKQRIVFEAFQQADAGASRKYGGTGLGLAISRELSQVLGGEIGLHSMPGRGSTFTLYLPTRHVGPSNAVRAHERKLSFAYRIGVDPAVAPDNPAAAIADHRRGRHPGEDVPLIIEDDEPKEQRGLHRFAGSNENLVGRKVLLVDDDALNVFALSSILERRKMHVLPASTGKEAIQIVDSTSDLDVVLVDIMMPEMDGYQTIERIRLNGKLRGLPIIALTAKAMKGDREKYLRAGASDYIEKPVNTEQLLSTLKIWLHR